MIDGDKREVEAAMVVLRKLVGCWAARTAAPPSYRPRF
jgi:hypothetical protein